MHLSIDLRTTVFGSLTVDNGTQLAHIRAVQNDITCAAQRAKHDTDIVLQQFD